MNYKKIYDDLIEHRKMLPKIDGVYYERHHVVPRCLGGGDEEGNLIWLTAREHLIAHLLLAKAYDLDDLWFAVQAMTMPTKNGKRVSNSRTFSIVRQELARRMGHYTMDHTLYEFRDTQTGEVFFETRVGLERRYGWRQGGASKLVLKEVLYHHGVCLASTTVERKMLDNTIYTFKHMPTGEVYNMTRRQFSDFTQIPISQVHPLIEEKQKTLRDYCLAKTCDPKRRRSPTHNFRNIATGEVIHASVTDMHLAFGLNRGSVKALVAGELLTTGGFCLDSTPIGTPGLNRAPRKSKYMKKAPSCAGPLPS